MSAKHVNGVDGVDARQQTAELAMTEDELAEMNVSARLTRSAEWLARASESEFQKDETMQDTPKEPEEDVTSSQLAAMTRRSDEASAISPVTQTQEQALVQQSEVDRQSDGDTDGKSSLVGSLESHTAQTVAAKCEAVDDSIGAVQQFESDASKKRADSRLDRAAEEGDLQHRDTSLSKHEEAAGSIVASASPDTQMPWRSPISRQCSLHSNSDDEIGQIAKFAKCSVSEARNFWEQAKGNPHVAMALAMTAKTTASTIQHLIEPQVQHKPVTLLHEALTEFATKPPKLRKRGDVAVILDLEDLSRTILLQSVDLAESSPFFELVNDDTQDIQGVRQLYILLPSTHNHTMPVLVRHDIHVMREDFMKPLATSKVEKRQLRSADKAPVKLETSSTPEAGKATDWIGAYETSFRMLGHFPPPYAISNTNVAHALPKIEAISTIVKHYNISPESAVHSAFSSLFTGFINDRLLWVAVAQDAARWLLIGMNLKSSLLYCEAFSHIVGTYPEWPWSRQPQDLTVEVLCAIRTQAQCLHYRRMEVDRQLTFLTISGNNSVAHTVTNAFRDWLLDHLSHLANDSQEHSLQSDTCDHSSPDAECLNLAGLYRTLNRGGDAYMPAETMKAKVGKEDATRLALKQIKKRAAEIVASLLKSSLQYERKDGLKYLTCVEVEDADVPWARGMRVEDEDDMDCL